MQFVAPSAYPLGGVAVWLDYLANGLPDLGWEPTVGLVAGHWHDVDSYVATYPRLPWVAIGNPPGSAEGRLRALEAAVREQAPDVVVGVNIADLFGACQRIRYRGGRDFRTVMAIHAIAADLLEDLGRERDRVDAVIATNRLTCRLCTEVGGMAPERVHYAPYGVDLAALGGIRRVPDEGPLRIAYVGRLDHDQKRVDMLPRVLGELERAGVDFRLEIVGDGPLKDSLLGALAPWIARNQARFLGMVPPESLGDRVYARTDVLLVTSSWETGPIVIWEAMAAGTAVVTARYVGSGLEGALRHEVNCLMFPVDDVAEAARQLERITVPGLAEALVAAGRALVAERYSIPKSVRAWANCLDTVRNTPPREQDGTWPRPPARGRLDRLAGVGLGENLRRMLRKSFRHGNAGGEWPHSLSGAASDEAFFRLAAEHDKP